MAPLLPLSCRLNNKLERRTQMADFSGNGLKILLLEDETVIAGAIARILAFQGNSVEIAINGLIAKDKIDSNPAYDLFILDIKTPIMNGIQLYEYLEQEHAGLLDRVVFTTGDSLGLVTKVFLERVNRPVLSKPFTPMQLTSLIQEVSCVGVLHT
jgi:CheY-like chemotaxis protein